MYWASSTWAFGSTRTAWMIAGYAPPTRIPETTISATPTAGRRQLPREPVQTNSNATKTPITARIALAGSTALTSVQEAPSNLSPRSEEHTSELQSRGHLVCRLLLEKQ